MEWLDDILDKQFILGVVGGLLATALSVLAAYFCNRFIYLFQKQGIDTELSGYWIVQFCSRFTPEKQAIEIYKFSRTLKQGHKGQRYRFRYQHFNSTVYKDRPLLGGGIALTRGSQMAGVYGFDESPTVVGALLLKSDDTTKGKHSPRLLGSYYEYDGERVSQTIKERFVLYKIRLSTWKKILFLFSRGCMSGYENAAAFYSKLDEHHVFSPDSNKNQENETTNTQHGAPADAQKAARR